jgi:hypothetical protein
VKGGCKACESFEPHTINRLLALGYGSRFVAERMPSLTRQDVRRHQRECFPQLREDVRADLLSLGGGDGS